MASQGRVSNSNLWLWATWWVGAVTFPVASRLLPRDNLPIPALHHHALELMLVWMVAFALMAFAMWRLRHVGLKAMLVVQLVGGAIVASSLAMPSLDVYAYLGYGDMLLHGENPWQPPLLPLRSPLVEADVIVWGNPPSASAYGPTFVAFQAAIVGMFSKLPVWVLVYLDRGVSLLAAVGVTALLRGPRIRFWALNPFVLYNFGLEAHNDVLFLFLIACSLRVRSAVVAGVAIGIASGIKFVAIAAVAYRKRWVAISGLLTMLLTALLVPHYREVVGALGDTGGQFHHSISWVIYVSLRRFQVAETVAKSATYASVAFLALLCAIGLRCGKRDAFAVYATLFVLAIPTIWPWYFAWPLFAAITTARRKFLVWIVWISLLSFGLEIGQFVIEPPAGELAFDLAFLVFIVAMLFGPTLRAFGEFGVKPNLLRSLSEHPARHVPPQL